MYNAGVAVMAVRKGFKIPQTQVLWVRIPSPVPIRDKMEYPHNIEKVYGPYTRKSDGREVVRLKLTNGKFKMKSYARYLKEIELGRELDRNEETVDHKNRNHTDNEAENLQILTRVENAAKSALRREDVKDNCVYCGTEFTLTKSQVRNSSRRQAGPFCSRKCTGLYGKSIQMGGGTLPLKDITVTYKRNDD